MPQFGSGKKTVLLSYVPAHDLKEHGLIFSSKNKYEYFGGLRPRWEGEGALFLRGMGAGCIIIIIPREPSNARRERERQCSSVHTDKSCIGKLAWKQNDDLEPDDSHA